MTLNNDCFSFSKLISFSFNDSKISFEFLNGCVILKQLST